MNPYLNPVPPPAILGQDTSEIIQALEALGIGTMTVSEFAEQAEKHPLSLAEKNTILDQAERILRDLYAHLPFKQETFRADPFTALQDLRNRVNGPDPPCEVQFHVAVVAAFTTVRDVHTSYVLPAEPFDYQGAVAFLPFQVSFYEENGARIYLVTAVSGMSVTGFTIGARLVGWNGVDMDKATLEAARLKQAGSTEVNYARGVQRLTLRPVATTGLLTDENSVVVDFIAPDDTLNPPEVSSVAVPWLVGTALGVLTSLPTSVFSSSHDLCAADQARELLYCKTMTPPQGTNAGTLTDPALLPETFSFTFTGGPADSQLDPSALTSLCKPKGKFGHIQIRRFLSNALDINQSLVDAFRKILRIMELNAPDGLVVDIRGNTGGGIQGAERMLQMLTPRSIRPALFHLANTEKILDILRDAVRHPGSPLEQWVNDALAASRTAPITPGKTLTGQEEANNIGQIYQGPVVLLIDGLTYSAGDMFAAGFQDNLIGAVIGVDSSTGGGGASVWRHEDLLSRLPHLDLGLSPLPGKSTMGLAVMRTTRVGANEEQPIEDVGVKADVIRCRTRKDVLGRSADLLAFACEHLAHREICRIAFSADPVAVADGVQVALIVQGMDSVDFFLDDHPVLANQPVSVEKPFAFATILPYPEFESLNSPPKRMRVAGFRRAGSAPTHQDVPVAVKNFLLPQPDPSSASQPGGVSSGLSAFVPSAELIG